MINHEILDDMQAVVMSMGPGDVARAEAGALMFMTDGIDMDARIDGGLLGGLRRKLLAGGTIVPFDLKTGERLRVDTGCLVAFDASVDYDITRVGGIKTSLFSGEGLFFASLTGPGRVWLQTRPFWRLAERIHSAYKGDREDVKRDFGGALGKIGDLIGGE